MKFTIEVGIADTTFMSQDEAVTWNRRKRVVPWRIDPVCYPDANTWRPVIAAARREWIDSVFVASSGNGIAVGHRTGDTNGSLIWTTANRGITWESVIPQSVAFPERLPDATWPPERISSAVVAEDNTFYLAWTDPWLFDGVTSHLIAMNAGAAIKYQRVDDLCICLSATAGAEVRAFSSDRIWATTATSRVWTSRPYAIKWDSLPSCFDSTLGRLRSPCFISDAVGFALVVRRHKDDRRPPMTGLARTRDGGRQWVIVHEWEGPTFGDMNERHATDLKVLLPSRSHPPTT